MVLETCVLLVSVFVDSVTSIFSCQNKSQCMLECILNVKLMCFRYMLLLRDKVQERAFPLCLNI